MELVLEGQICREIKAWNPEFKPNTGSQQDEEQGMGFALICPITLETGLQMCSRDSREFVSGLIPRCDPGSGRNGAAHLP